MKEILNKNDIHILDIREEMGPGICNPLLYDGLHPNDNTATVWMKTKDLIEIIKEHGNEIKVIEIKKKV